MRPPTATQARPEAADKRIKRAYAILSNPNELIVHRLDALDELLNERHRTDDEDASGRIYAVELAREIGPTGRVVTATAAYTVGPDGKLKRGMR